MAAKKTAEIEPTEQQRTLAEDFARLEAEREAEYQRAREEVEAFNAIPESERTHFYYPGDTYIASVTSEAVVANATKYELERRARIRREDEDYKAARKPESIETEVNQGAKSDAELYFDALLETHNRLTLKRSGKYPSKSLVASEMPKPFAFSISTLKRRLVEYNIDYPAKGVPRRR